MHLADGRELRGSDVVALVCQVPPVHTPPVPGIVTMHDVAPPAMGKLYAIASGPHFGIHTTWKAEFQRESFTIIEFNPNSGRPDRRMSGTNARTRALAWLLGTSSGAEHAAVQAMLDSEQQLREQAAAAGATRRAEAEATAAAAQRAREQAAADAWRAQQEARDRAEAERQATEAAERRERERREREEVQQREARETREREREAARAAELEATQVALASQAAPVIESAALDCLLRALVAEAMASWRAGKTCERSAEAKARRRQKRKQRQPVAAVQTAGASAAADTAVRHHDAQSEDAAMLAAENQALRGQLAQKSALLVLTRKQKKRAENTSRQRGQQLKVRSSKEQKRLARRLGAKQQRAVDGAARREAVRVRKRKQPASEILHSSERKHQRLLGKGGGGSGNGAGSSVKGCDAGRGRGWGGGRGRGRQPGAC